MNRSIVIASLRLGKTSVDAIKNLSKYRSGILDPFSISVVCTQVPQELCEGVYVIIWLGSDNNKGIPTEWKQGYKAFGRVKSIIRGKSYNDESTTIVDILYAFGESINRLDFLKKASEAYYDCSALPIIGLDDHSNQTIRMLQSNGERYDIGAMFYALNSMDQSFMESLLKIDKNFNQFFQYIPPSKRIVSIQKEKNTESSSPRQIIYYGAPGTGKSHSVKCETKAWEEKGRVVRTTFHPDSDYSTFVGAYKPTTESVQRYDIYNKPMTKDGQPVMEQIITYEFVAQAFLQAYIDAWKNREEPEFLIIEEINRGNCAQIFGDLFQLLDRGDNGYSEYSVRADKDLQKHLAKAFADVVLDDYPKVKSGEVLILPKNLYIRATMNTSDQSLFPIDSAFKRRWDWKYVPIAKGNGNGVELNWEIAIDSEKYDWWTFIETINKHIFGTTNSEDKQLGFFFCKAKDNIIDAETFVGKVIFYLWNDVFKDYGFDGSIFADKDDIANPKLSFDKFYLPNGKVNKDKIKIFLTNLELEPTDNSINLIDSKIEIKVNGNIAKYINAIPYMVIDEYVRLNPHKTAAEVVNVWSPFKKYSMRSWIVCNKQEHDEMAPKYANYSYEIKCADGQSLWVNKDGWMHHPENPSLRDTIAEFVEAVNEAELGITITETAI